MGIGERGRTMQKVDGNIVIISESNDLDMYEVDKFAKSIWQKEIEEGHHLILDLSLSNYIDAYGIRAILQCRKQATDLGLNFGVVPSTPLNRLADILRIGQSMLPRFNTIEDAIQAFSS